MIEPRADTDTSALDALQDVLSKQQAILKRVTELANREFAVTVLPKVQREAKPVRLPIAWTSERQRRAYFATRGFGKGIPYRRTGKLLRSWQFVDLQNGIEVRNNAPYAAFVYGRLGVRAGAWKQQFHTNTGWITAADVIAPAIQKYDARVRELFANAGGIDGLQRQGQFQASGRQRTGEGAVNRRTAGIARSRR